MICDNCGGLMVRTGTCHTCVTCGDTTGCGRTGHRISVTDFDHVGAFLFESTATDPTEVIPSVEEEAEELPGNPPAVSGYRAADVAGVACFNCAHFTIVADTDGDGDIDGICNLWESQADGEFTCDRFTAHADLLRQGPHTTWHEDQQNEAVDKAMEAARQAAVDAYNYSDTTVLNEILFASPNAEEADGLVWKDILRTGEWKQTPTNRGIVNKSLQIIDEGESDPINGIISLSELEGNFNDGAIRYVTVPLSDEEKKDHKNIARVNTGFVRKLKRVARDGQTFLRAGIDFTEPEIKEKVLRGTIPDVSPGVPFGVTRRKDKKFFKTVLDHVCLTSKPFIDGLGPFGIAAADSDAEMPTEFWEEEENKPTEEKPEPKSEEDNQPTISFRQLSSEIQKALANQLRLSPDYIVDDISGTTAFIKHRTSEMKWQAQFRHSNVPERPVIVAGVDHWELVEEENTPEEQQPIAASDSGITGELQRAHELRELRLAQPTSTTGGTNMAGLADLSLGGVELSDEARRSIESVLEENATLKRRDRESDVDARITELSDVLGLKERPGALKFYRQVMLSDDGGPAMILLSDDSDEKKNQKITGIEILDRFIDALKAEGGVELSDQALASGSDVKPPKDANGERAPLEDRVKNAQTALYGKRNRRQ